MLEETPPASTPTQAPEQVADHVNEAATSATQAATATGDDGWKVVAEELRGLRGDITKLMETSHSAVATAAAPATTSAEPHEPHVEVEVPKPPERKVRRGARKVVKRG